MPSVNICTREKCILCGQQFAFSGLYTGLICFEHKIRPNRYFIDLYYHGQRYRFYTRPDGRPLNTWFLALVLAETIEFAILNGTFNPEDFKAID
ncbi:MAG: hypothetical protein ACLPN1_05950 [Dissulfurispiraceae bacterium]